MWIFCHSHYLLYFLDAFTAYATLHLHTHIQYQFSGFTTSMHHVRALRYGHALINIHFNRVNWYQSYLWCFKIFNTFETISISTELCQFNRFRSFKHRTDTFYHKYFPKYLTHQHTAYRKHKVAASTTEQKPIFPLLIKWCGEHTHKNPFHHIHFAHLYSGSASLMASYTVYNKMFILFYFIIKCNTIRQQRTSVFRFICILHIEITILLYLYTATNTCIVCP